MLATAIIIFRELLEICLLLGIISAALSNLDNRRTLISFGILGGSLLSFLIFLSFKHLYNSFNGNFQEYLNIFIIILSICCIAYTSFIINAKKSSLLDRIRMTNSSLDESRFNNIVIILFIALIICREGAEIFIFMQALFASGQSPSNIIVGALIGTFTGLITGLIFYFSLLKISLKYLFKVINTLLILCSGALASQLANLLHTTNMISSLYKQVWNSSWFIQDNSFIGITLYNLIGYTAKPTQLQIILYLITLSIMSYIAYLRKSFK